MKCVNCRYHVGVSFKFGMKPTERIETKTYRCSHFEKDMDIDELNNERECEGYEEL